MVEPAHPEADVLYQHVGFLFSAHQESRMLLALCSVNPKMTAPGAGDGKKPPPSKK